MARLHHCGPSKFQRSHHRTGLTGNSLIPVSKSTAKLLTIIDIHNFFGHFLKIFDFLIPLAVKRVPRARVEGLSGGGSHDRHWSLNNSEITSLLTITPLRVSV